MKPDLDVLLAYVSATFARGEPVTASSPLLGELVDSLAVYDLVTFVSDRWGIVLDELDLDLDALATVGSFFALVTARHTERQR